MDMEDAGHSCRSPPCGTCMYEQITEIIFVQINIYILTYCLSHLACTLHKIIDKGLTGMTCS